jgi:murein DD-endopeptidase MepM/ murein hydrolase activator NlpD
MFSLLSEFTRKVREVVTVIVMKENELEEPRRYSVQPIRLFAIIAASVLGLSVVLVLVVAMTPVGSILPGRSSSELRQDARLNQIRMEAMADTLRLQSAYVDRLRNLLMGTVDTTVTLLTRSNQVLSSRASAEIGQRAQSAPSDFDDHLQPAFPLDRLAVPGTASNVENQQPGAYLSAIRFPVLPPVSGLTTRTYDARSGHFAIDIAVKEGSLVRSIGDGYVILADWTHDGGQIIAIQHGDGYVSVYKHNSRLLKRAGERVRAREAVASSGNSGEITSGPHVHFELWHNGLAQDPGYYVTGL